MTTTSGQTEFGPMARCFQNSAALLGRHCPHACADRSLQLGNVSGLIFVGPFLEMTPDVEVRRREVRRLRWLPGECALGDEPPLPPEAFLEGRSGCMSGSTILLQPLLYGYNWRSFLRILCAVELLHLDSCPMCRWDFWTILNEHANCLDLFCCSDPLLSSRKRLLEVANTYKQ